MVDPHYVCILYLKITLFSPNSFITPKINISRLSQLFLDVLRVVKNSSLSVSSEDFLSRDNKAEFSECKQVSFWQSIHCHSFSIFVPSLFGDSAV